MENLGLTISPWEVLNPATLLLTPNSSLHFLSCLEILNLWTKPQDWFSEDPLINPEENWYTGRSSSVLDGKRKEGYAVVFNFETIEAKTLPPVISAQFSSVQSLSHIQLCNPTDFSTPGFPVHHQLPKLA